MSVMIPLYLGVPQSAVRLGKLADLSGTAVKLYILGCTSDVSVLAVSADQCFEAFTLRVIALHSIASLGGGGAAAWLRAEVDECINNTIAASRGSVA
jgi:hypothetical protein